MKCVSNHCDSKPILCSGGRGGGGGGRGGRNLGVKGVGTHRRLLNG